MSRELWESYVGIYTDSLNEARDTSPAARAAAAKRLEGLKNNPKHNAYSTPKGNKFGKHNDAWSHDPRADAEYEKANKKVTKEEIIIDYLLDEGYVDTEESAEVLIDHMSEEWENFILDEMRKVDKVAGKQSGGTKDPAMRYMKKELRKAQGTPEGQQKKVPGKKPPRAGEYGGPMSPKTKVNINRVRRQEGERNMSSRFD
ncbi:hypothetical protein SCRM01_291 [Synechococcus phage S-CRM01]|uniref:hypothetical protein n=1 Tax=Synechococcus phage S-CRM01 TaxID=1026955 RepID=UPI000209E31F|nr:hypothetical protein SCRM01_291 [Synechococcus phage S-CRM01]AEC53237.1 hypothetical protein SCRM01_291 [Synechococcus phage S-CRM01]